jgi:hypothetical protein
MHHAYVIGRLQRWGLWSWERVDGFRVAQVRYAERTDREYMGGAAIPLQGESLETESAVSWLRLRNRRMGDCVIYTFRDHVNYSGEMIAQLLGVGRRTVWRDLTASYVLLTDYFSARAAGLPMPQLVELRSRRKGGLDDSVEPKGAQCRRAL